MDMFRKILHVVSFLFLAGFPAFSQPSASYSQSMWKAQQGEAQAQAAVAYYLKNGIWVDKNLEQAKEWANKAAKSRDGLAYWLLAQIGQEQGDSPQSILNYLEKALACEYPLAFSFFGRLFESGSPEFGINQDGQRAFTLLEQAANAGDAEAAAYIGYLYLKRENDQVNAFHYLHEAAAKNKAEAMSLVASMFDYGIGTNPDPETAFEWYKKAAAAGSQAGILGLADSYRLGLATAPDQEEAFSYYRKVSSPSPYLQYVIGYYYAMGEATEQDIPQALSLLRQSADSGNVFAQAFLGTTQYEGVVPFKGNKDANQALPYLKTAFDNGDFSKLPASARRTICRYLSEYYRSGRGVGKDVAFADELMRKADAIPEEDSAPLPFAMIGKRSFEECMEAYVQTPLSSPETTLLKITFDYPIPEDIQVDSLGKEEDSSFESSRESQPLDIFSPADSVIPVEEIAVRSFHTLFVWRAQGSIVFSVNKEKAFTAGMCLGVYDIGGSRMGLEAGAYYCPVGFLAKAFDGLNKGVSPYGIDASLVLRVAKGVYPKVGAGYYSYKEYPKESPNVNGLCGILGLSFLLGKHLCLEIGSRYYPNTRILNPKMVSAGAVHYIYPTAETIFKGFSPMIGIGVAF